MGFIKTTIYEVKLDEVDVLNEDYYKNNYHDYPHLASIFNFLIEGNMPKPRGNYADEYKLLAVDFFQASINLLHYVTNHRDNYNVIDYCSLPMMFNMRHAIELVLKAAILKQNKNAKSTHKIFQQHSHNIKELYDVLIIKPHNDEWLTRYFSNMTFEDPNENLFRYSMNSVFRDKYNSIDSIRTTGVSIYAFDSIVRFYFNDYVLDKDDEKECLVSVKRFSPNGEYLIEPSDGLESMSTWQINDQDLYKQITGFRDAGKVLFLCKENNFPALELPTIHNLWHSLEISMKTLITDLHKHVKNDLKKPGIKDIPDIAYNTHDFKDIWKYGKRIFEFFVTLYKWDIDKLAEIEKAILYIHNIDKHASYFRYPTNKNLEYHNHNNIDLDKAFKTFSTLIELMNGMDDAVSDINDSINEMLSIGENEDY